MQMMQAPDECRISDVHLAAYLLARGHQVSRLEGSFGRREFVFHDVPQDVLLSYYGGDDLVSARELLDALRNIRGLLVQGVRR